MSVTGFGDVAERLRRSTVQILHRNILHRNDCGMGSGVIWRPDGMIVTNAHVAPPDHATVELWDGRRFDAEVTLRDQNRDLATLQIRAADLPAATPGDSSALRPGELVLAIGNPLGFIGALTTGVVHALGPVSALGRRSWVQATVRLAPGNSGGPLADAQGRVIGVNTMIVGAGLALAIPSNTVGHFLRVKGNRLLLGVVVQPVVLEQGTFGLLVLEVSAGGPADLASLLPGDVLTGAGAEPFRSVNDLGDAMEQSRGILSLQFVRGNRRSPREVSVQLRTMEAAA